MKECIGGVEKTLIEWIKTIPKDKYQITLYLINVEGELLSKVPDFVRIVKIPDLNEILNGNIVFRLKWMFHNKGFIDTLKFIRCCLIHKVNHIRGSYYDSIVDFLPNKQEQYDYVICYTMPDSICVSYTAKKISGRYRWMWSHVDINFYQNHELDGMQEFYNMFDKIVNVSEYAKKSFEERYPNLIPKSVLVKNYINVREIIECSSLTPVNEFSTDDICLLTVGRVTYQKGQDIAIAAAKELVKQNVSIKWYFIGPKSDINFYDEISQFIKNEHLENIIIYLGTSDNPYSFMKKCDIYVQPSRYEGYCTTVTEAQILCKPIVMTDVAGAREQIENGKTGFITPISPIAIAEKIKYLIEHKDKRDEFENNLKEQLCMSEIGFTDIIDNLKL